MSFSFLLRPVRACLALAAALFLIALPAAAQVSLLHSVDPTPNGAGWNKTGVTVHLSATPGSLGTVISYIRYTVNGGAPVTVYSNSTSFPLTGEGIYTIVFEASIGDGSLSAPESFTVKIDQTDPTVSANPSPSANGYGWNNTDVQVTLNASDEGASSVCTAAAASARLARPAVPGSVASPVSGVKSITYTIDGGSPVTVPGNLADFTLTSEGVHTIEATATDNADNVSSTLNLTVRIDKTAPTTNIDVSGNQVTVNGFDEMDGSGIDKIFYQINGGMQQEYTGPVTVPSDASFTHWAVDKAGNSGTPVTTTPVPVALVKFGLIPNSIAVGAGSTGTVTLSNPAPAGGTVVSLASNNLMVAGVGATVTVAEGETAATFSVSGVGVGDTRIVAALGAISLEAPISVTAAVPLRLMSVSVSPSPMARSSAATGTVTLSAVAPMGGVVVYLSRSKNGVTIPVSVTVPYGQSSVTFAVTSGAAPVTLTITANSAVGKKAVNLTVL